MFREFFKKYKIAKNICMYSISSKKIRVYYYIFMAFDSKIMLHFHHMKLSEMRVKLLLLLECFSKLFFSTNLTLICDWSFSRISTRKYFLWVVELKVEFFQPCDVRFLSYKVSNVQSRDRTDGTYGTVEICTH